MPYIQKVTVELSDDDESSQSSSVSNDAKVCATSAGSMLTLTTESPDTTGMTESNNDCQKLSTSVLTNNYSASTHMNTSKPKSRTVSAGSPIIYTKSVLESAVDGSNTSTQSEIQPSNNGTKPQQPQRSIMSFFGARKATPKPKVSSSTQKILNNTNVEKGSPIKSLSQTSSSDSNINSVASDQSKQELESPSKKEEISITKNSTEDNASTVAKVKKSSTTQNAVAPVKVTSTQEPSRSTIISNDIVLDNPKRQESNTLISVKSSNKNESPSKPQDKVETSNEIKPVMTTMASKTDTESRKSTKVWKYTPDFIRLLKPGSHSSTSCFYETMNELKKEMEADGSYFVQDKIQLDEDKAIDEKTTDSAFVATSERSIPTYENNSSFNVSSENHQNLSCDESDDGLKVPTQGSSQGDDDQNDSAGTVCNSDDIAPDTNKSSPSESTPVKNNTPFLLHGRKKNKTPSTPQIPIIAPHENKNENVPVLQNPQQINWLQGTKKSEKTKSLIVKESEKDEKSAIQHQEGTINILQSRKKSKKRPADTPTQEIHTQVGAVHTLTPRKKQAQNKPAEVQPLQPNQHNISMVQESSQPLKPGTVMSMIQNPISQTKVFADAVPLQHMNELQESNSKTKIATEPKTRKPNTDLQEPMIQDTSHLTKIAVPTEENKYASSENPTNTTPPLSDDIKAIIEKHDSLKKLYRTRMDTLVERALSGELEEEDFQLEIHNNERLESYEKYVPGTPCDDDFQDEWLPHLVMLVQGSPLSLDALANRVHSELCSDGFGGNSTISIDSIAAKIKLIATRTQYLLPTNPNEANKLIDIFSSTQSDLMWRWEVSSLDLLPDEKKSIVKKARSARKKVLYHQKAILKLLATIDETNNALSCPSGLSRKDTLIARLHVEEEKALKYEREAEKARFVKEAKMQKEKEKVSKQLEREKEKERLEEEKRKLKMEKEEERELKKRAIAESKRKSEEEAIKQKEEKANKQKARMMSFFNKGVLKNESSPKKSKVSVPETLDEITDSAPRTLDSDKFWSKLGFSCSIDQMKTPFSMLSKEAKLSRKRKTNLVKVRVFTTAASENPFDNRVYDEEKIITVRNRYKYLSFHEDLRPPYHGTWSKPKSSIVRGNNPFGKDCEYIDYDVDSEAEWEEGDDDQGEDCSDQGNEEEDIDDEEGDTRVYNFDDGWLAHDDDLDYQDDDDDTLESRRRRIDDPEQKSSAVTNLSPPFIIAPLLGGVPPLTHDDSCPALIPENFQGCDISNAQKILLSLQSEVLLPSLELSTEIFPGERQIESKEQTNNQQTKNTTNKIQNETSEDNLRVFAEFVHKCTINSKDAVVEDFLSNYKGIFPSRAQATRKLLSIANKRRLKKGAGVVWEVKDTVLLSLGLGHLISKTSEEEIDVENDKSIGKCSDVMEIPDILQDKVNKPTTSSKVDVPSSKGPAIVSPPAKNAHNNNNKRKRAVSPQRPVNANIMTFLKKQKM